MRKRPKRMQIVLFLYLMLFACWQVNAQDLKIQGKVTDVTTNESLPGVSIAIKGSSQGTISRSDGNYEISVPQGSILVFSFIGYTTQEITISTDQVLDVKLEASVKTLDEIIIIGYGSQKKSDKTGAVSHITAEELGTGVLTDPVQALQGKLAGVTVSKSGGDPNSGFAVTIRGAISISANTDPLYVIDGVPGADPTTVAPEEIESYNVLKDASSTAIYGSRGSNGVIIITTKTGKQQKGSLVEVSSYYSYDQVAKRLDLMTADDWRNYAKQKGLTFTDGGANTDWQDAIFRNGTSQSHGVSISGGNDHSTYRASLTYADFKGVVIGSDKQRTIGHVNLTQKALDNKLTFQTNLSGTVEGNNYINYGGWGVNDVLYQAYQRNPSDPIYNADGSYFETSRSFNYYNPVAIVKKIQNHRDATRFLGGFKTDFEIVKGLVASANLSYLRNSDESFYFSPTTLVSTPLGSASRGYNNYSSKLLETTISYNNTFAELHNISVIGGYSYQQEDNDGFKAGGKGPTSNYMLSNSLADLTIVTASSDISSYKNRAKLVSFLGRASYNFNSRYYVTGTIRKDGSTRFGTNKKWGIFPSASLGWTMKEEPFLKDVAFINFLKLRAGYGTSGNQNIGNNLAVMNYYVNGAGINPETGLTSVNFDASHDANPNLQWEVTKEVNLGLDFGIYNNRVSGSIELYNKTTDHLLYPYTIPTPPSATGTQWANVGKIENKGIEVSIQAFVVNTKNFKWKAASTFTLNRQKVVNLSGGIYTWTPQHVGYLQGPGLVGSDNWTQIVAPGYEIGTFYMPEYAGLNAEGLFLFKTATGGVTREPSKAERRVVGHGLPRWEAGLSNYFTLFNVIDVSIALRTMQGNDVLNATKLILGNPSFLNNLSSNLLKDALDANAKGIKSAPVVNSYYIEDGSFIRIDNVTIGYTFSKANTKWVKTLRVYFTANNLYTFTKYTGLDPEGTLRGLSFGVDNYNVYPKTRNFSFGVNYKF